MSNIFQIIVLIASRIAREAMKHPHVQQKVDETLKRAMEKWKDVGKPSADKLKKQAEELFKTTEANSGPQPGSKNTSGSTSTIENNTPPKDEVPWFMQKKQGTISRYIQMQRYFWMTKRREWLEKFRK
jgi:hypothetical protein